ncbi:hypothetical protein BCR44DRAFT_1017322 [Catenaria anguillulae PL171]|uniref:Uncharacterized protein n=1 Tax=Catenaria anguillulae PL171 TaxID=765915 RepID=A0A1Y2HUD9_9FUNG|nr:hypothetical protein BCR44DRAFT_1017322 [Catenaria anguillulae PL171]
MGMSDEWSTQCLLQKISRTMRFCGENVAVTRQMTRPLVPTLNHHGYHCQATLLFAMEVNTIPEIQQAPMTCATSHRWGLGRVQKCQVDRKYLVHELAIHHGGRRIRTSGLAQMWMDDMETRNQKKAMSKCTSTMNKRRTRKHRQKCRWMYSVCVGNMEET